jgi:hypothetical protein
MLGWEGPKEASEVTSSSTAAGRCHALEEIDAGATRAGTERLLRRGTGAGSQRWRRQAAASANGEVRGLRGSGYLGEDGEGEGAGTPLRLRSWDAVPPLSDGGGRGAPPPSGRRRPRGELRS